MKPSTTKTRRPRAARTTPAVIASLACLSAGPLLTACSEQGGRSQADTQAQGDAHAGHDHAEQSNAETTQAEAESAQPGGGSASGETLDVAGFQLTVPSGWNTHPPSNSMRLAELHVPNPEGDASVAAISVAGGGAQMNIDRWVGQFSNPAGEVVSSRETRQLAGHTVHLVEMSGEYHGMGMRPPEPDTMMRAAIVEQPSGQHLFIKMTGPIAHMQTLGEGWETMISSLRSP